MSYVYRRIRTTTAQSLAAAALVVFCARAAVADDWNQWRGPQRDGVAGDFAAPDEWPRELSRVWSVGVGAGHSSPVVAGGKIYQFSRDGENEMLSTYDQRGLLLWQRKYAAPYKVNSAARGHGKGPKSTPTVAGDRVFTLGISGILSCFDADDGALHWRRDFVAEFASTSPEFGAAASPLVIGPQCIVHVGGKDDGALTSFDVDSGEPRWSWKLDGPAYTSPILAELNGMQQIITQTQKHCLSVSTGGKPLWSIPYETGYEQNIVTPVVFGDLAIFSGYQRGVTAYRIGRQGDQFTTAEAWHTDDVSMYMSSPVLIEGALYGYSERNSGQFFRLAPQSGEVAWTGPPRQGENALLLAGGDVIMGLVVSGDLVVFRQIAERYDEIARYRVAESPTWAHPAIDGDRLLIKNADTLSMWLIER